MSYLQSNSLPVVQLSCLRLTISQMWRDQEACHGPRPIPEDPLWLLLC
jgi:hypothetical protein